MERGADVVQVGTGRRLLKLMDRWRPLLEVVAIVAILAAVFEAPVWVVLAAITIAAFVGALCVVIGYSCLSSQTSQI